jgi:hypothetical protein
VKHALVGEEAGAVSTRAGAARATLERARDATARVVELIDEAQRHLDDERFDARRAGIALELLRAARKAADACLREAQEQADLTLDAAVSKDVEAERRASGFQVPPAPAPSRPAQRARAASGSVPVQQRKPTS